MTTTRRRGTSASTGPNGWRRGHGRPSVRSSRSMRSRSPGRAGTCTSASARRRGPVTSWCASKTPSSNGATSRSALSRSTSDGPIASRSSVPTGRARPRWCRRCSAGSPWRRGSWRIGPSVVVGELAQDRRVLQDAPVLADAFMAATGLAREHARSQLAKFGLGADGGAPTVGVAVARRAHPGRAGCVRRHRRQLPRARRTDQSPRPAGHRTVGVGPRAAIPARSCSSRTTAGCSSRCR